MKDDISNYFDNPLNISVNIYQISFNQSKDLSSAEDQQTFFSDESNFIFEEQVNQNTPNSYFIVEDFFRRFYVLY